MATYFINPATGSDLFDGSSATPWASIAKANSVGYVAGNVYNLAGGQTHSGGFDISGISTDSVNVITIQQYGSGFAVIDPGTGAGVKITDTSFVRVLGPNLSIIGPGVSLSGTFPSRTGTTTSTAAAIEVVCSTTGVWYDGLTVDGVTIADCLFGVRVRSTAAAATKAYRNSTIQGANIAGCGVVGIAIYGTGTVDGQLHVHAGILYDAFTLNNNVITNCPGVTSYQWGNSTGSFSSGYGYYLLSLQNSIASGNYVASCGTASSALSSGGPVGLMWAKGTTNTTRGNEIRDQFAPEGVDGMAFDADLDEANHIFERNYAHDCDGGGFLSYNSTGTQIRFNIVENCGRRCDVGGVRETSSSNLFVYNNTFLFTKTGTPTKLFLVGVGKFYNNNFSIRGSGAVFGTFTPGGQAAFIGNNWDAPSPASFSITSTSGPTTYTSLASFRAAGFETSAGNQGLASDPLLSNPGNGGTKYPNATTTLTVYDPQVTSPLIGAGFDTSALVTRGSVDFHGRTLTDFTIGAVQYAAAGPRNTRLRL